MSDWQFAVSGRWALASDGIQWILQKRRYADGPWGLVSFVRSHRDILARCMREKGCPTDDAAQLLAGLPETFDQWAAERQQTIAAGVLGTKGGE
jgi:hypothetical protein